MRNREKKDSERRGITPSPPCVSSKNFSQISQSWTGKLKGNVSSRSEMTDDAKRKDKGVLRKAQGNRQRVENTGALGQNLVEINPLQNSKPK